MPDNMCSQKLVKSIIKTKRGLKVEVAEATKTQQYRVLENLLKTKYTKFCVRNTLGYIIYTKVICTIYVPLFLHIS